MRPCGLSLQFPSGSATPTQRLLCPLSCSETQDPSLYVPFAPILSLLPAAATQPTSTSPCLLQPGLSGVGEGAPTPTLTLTSPRCETEQERLSPDPTAGRAAWDSNPGHETLKPSPSHCGVGDGRKGKETPDIKWLGSSKKAGLLGSEPQSWPPSLTCGQGTSHSPLRMSPLQPPALWRKREACWLLQTLIPPARSAALGLPDHPRLLSAP